MKKITNGIFTPIIEIHEEIFQLFSQTCKPKTLEEVAERLYPTIHEQYQYDAFIQGAKWMQERMYSEEEVRRAFQDGQDNMDYSEMYGCHLN